MAKVEHSGSRGKNRPEPEAEHRPLPTATRHRGRKTSDIVSLEIIRDIVRQRLKEGDRLPIETEMIAHYRVSRPSLREALRLLEAQGLVVIRPGPGGGTMVGKTSPMMLARTMTLHLHLSESTYGDLAQAYALTEPLLGELAARNPDRARVRAAMEPFLDERTLRTPAGRALATGIGFHRALAELAGNAVLRLALDAIGQMFTEHVIATFGLRELVEDAHEDHPAIAQAIIDGTPDKASLLVGQHADHLVQRFKTAWPDLVGEKIQWR